LKIYVVNSIAIYVDKPRRRHLQRARSTGLLLHRSASTTPPDERLRQLHHDPICSYRAPRGTVCTGQGRGGRLRRSAPFESIGRADAILACPAHLASIILHAPGDKEQANSNKKIIACTCTRHGAKLFHRHQYLHCIKPNYTDPNINVKLYDYIKIIVEFYIANKNHRQGLHPSGLPPPPIKTPLPP
jgi:hypothetical protein